MRNTYNSTTPVTLYTSAAWKTTSQRSVGRAKWLNGGGCNVASAGLRTGQTGQLPRGLHKKGPPQKHTFF